ncbi:unnamed protein product [Meganyctiphanes norvegica]|uniref:Uncharacterized protein n=1 Tax=Meganyctiphanes norvegica TaxID=48144 RepID=A0AAV2RZ52_MEGNR
MKQAATKKSLFENQPGDNKNNGDGPMQYAPGPNKQHFNRDSSKEISPPYMSWNNELRHHSQNYINNNNYQRELQRDKSNNVEAGYLGWDSQKSQSRPSFHVNSPQRHKKINKVSYQVSDENEVIEEKAVYEDNFQVYHSVAHKKKIKCLEIF